MKTYHGYRRRFSVTIRHICSDCHHTPSGRFSGTYAAQCYCPCHDVADAGLELLAACEQAIIALAPRDGTDGRVSMTLVHLREVVAKAKGGDAC
jgi:hypothetical protein